MNVGIPDYVEPFEGWRIWRVDGDRGDIRLCSVIQDTVWPLRQELVAECLRRRILTRFRRGQWHASPVEDCACGIYATSLGRLGSYLQEPSDRRTRYVFGRVHLWGTIVECEHGWRASRAYPAEIIVPTSSRVDPAGIMAPPQPPVTGAAAEEIARGLSRYAVPIVVLPDSPVQALDAIAREGVRDRRRDAVR